MALYLCTVITGDYEIDSAEAAVLDLTDDELKEINASLGRSKRHSDVRIEPMSPEVGIIAARRFLLLPVPRPAKPAQG